MPSPAWDGSAPNQRRHNRRKGSPHLPAPSPPKPPPAPARAPPPRPHPPRPSAQPPLRTAQTCPSSARPSHPTTGQGRTLTPHMQSAPDARPRRTPIPVCNRLHRQAAVSRSPRYRARAASPRPAPSPQPDAPAPPATRYALSGFRTSELRAEDAQPVVSGDLLDVRARNPSRPEAVEHNWESGRATQVRYHLLEADAVHDDVTDNGFNRVLLDEIGAETDMVDSSHVGNVEDVVGEPVEGGIGRVDETRHEVHADDAARRGDPAKPLVGQISVVSA